MSRYLNPEPITHAEEERLQPVTAEVRDRLLSGVRYRFPATSQWPNDYVLGQVQEVDMAVVLNFGTVDMIISWAMHGYMEGLDVEVGRAGSFPPLAELQSEHEVGDTGPWREKLGRTLQEVSAAWQKNNRSPESVWALRFRFDDEKPMVIALGVIEQGALRYHPDGLLVLFDERELFSYSDTSIAHASQLWQPIQSSS